MDKAYRTQFVKNTQTAERQRAERQKTVQKHLNYSGMFVLHGGDDGDGNGLDNYSRSGGGGWVVQCSRGGTPKWLLLSFFCCYMTKCAPTKGSLFLLAGWWSSKRDPEQNGSSSLSTLCYDFCSVCRVQLLSVWAAIQFATSLSENTVFIGTRSFFRTGSALLRKYTEILQKGYHLRELNCGESTLQTRTVLMKEWGRPCLFTLAHNQRNDRGRRGHWSLAQQGLGGKKTPWKGACIKM